MIGKCKCVIRVILIILLVFFGITVYRTSVISIKQGEFLFQKSNYTVDKSEKSQTEDSLTDTSADWKLILVNKEHAIPDDYNIEFTKLSNGEKIDSRIYPELQKMFDAARTKGLQLFVREGYRTSEEQKQIMEERIKQYQEEGYSKKNAQKLAEEYVAIPGTSEHQLGICVDINADTSKTSSDEVYSWLVKNSYKYGFVKRYPSDKVEITGINNEPWHYRYVGKKAAKEMKEKNFCLEEYVEQLE